MSVETEVKIRLSAKDLEQVRARLQQLNGRRVSRREKELNLLFDFPDRRLQKEGCALRLRSYGGEAVLTFKGTPLQDPPFKRRQEVETKVQGREATRRLLETLGLEVCFRYSKFREIHALKAGTQTVFVCLDETPVGTFVEIEGSKKSIARVAQQFGWGADRFIRKSYVEMYEEAEARSQKPEAGSQWPGAGRAMPKPGGRLK